MDQLLENEDSYRKKIRPRTLKIQMPLILFGVGMLLTGGITLIFGIYVLDNLLKSGVPNYLLSMNKTRLFLFTGIHIINIVLLVFALARKKELFIRIAITLTLFYLGVSLWDTLFVIISEVARGNNVVLNYLLNALIPAGFALETAAFFTLGKGINRYNKDRGQEQNKVTTATEFDVKLVVTAILLLVIGVGITFFYQLNLLLQYQSEISKIPNGSRAIGVLLINEIAVIINFVLISIPIIFVMISLYTRKKAVAKRLALITAFLLAHIAYSVIFYLFLFVLFQYFEYSFIQFIMPGCGCILIMIAMWLMFLGIKEKK